MTASWRTPSTGAADPARSDSPGPLSDGRRDSAAGRGMLLRRLPRDGIARRPPTRRGSRRDCGAPGWRARAAPPSQVGGRARADRRRTVPPIRTRASEYPPIEYGPSVHRPVPSRAPTAATRRPRGAMVGTPAIDATGQRRAPDVRPGPVVRREAVLPSVALGAAFRRGDSACRPGPRRREGLGHVVGGSPTLLVRERRVRGRADDGSRLLSRYGRRSLARLRVPCEARRVLVPVGQ